MTAADQTRRILVAPLLAFCVLSAAALADEPAKTQPPERPTLPAVPDTSPQVTEGIINAPPSEVWKVFSTNEGFLLLGVAKADIDFRVGGLMRSVYNAKDEIGSPATIQNRIISFEPGRMISFRIDKPPVGFPFANAWKETWSVATFTDLGDGRTALRLAGVGYTADEESQKMRDFFRVGNAYTIKKLQAHFDKSVKLDPKVAGHAADPLAPIEIDTVIKAPREEVFRTYTTSEGWKSFFGVESKIELKPGGPFEIYFSMDPPAGTRGSEGCTVLSYIPNKMFSYTWNAPPKLAFARSQHTWVVITFEDLGPASTRVHATHLGFAELAAAYTDHADEFTQARAYFAKAWPNVLLALKQKWEPSTLQVEPTK